MLVTLYFLTTVEVTTGTGINDWLICAVWANFNYSRGLISKVKVDGKICAKSGK